MEQLKSYTPGDKKARKAIFSKMLAQAKKYRNPDMDVQAMTILNGCYELKINEFSPTTRAMIKLLKVYGDYEPLVLSPKL